MALAVLGFATAQGAGDSGGFDIAYPAGTVAGSQAALWVAWWRNPNTVGVDNPDGYGQSSQTSDRAGLAFLLALDLPDATSPLHVDWSSGVAPVEFIAILATFPPASIPSGISRAASSTGYASGAFYINGVSWGPRAYCLQAVMGYSGNSDWAWVDDTPGRTWGQLIQGQLVLAAWDRVKPFRSAPPDTSIAATTGGGVTALSRTFAGDVGYVAPIRGNEAYIVWQDNEAGQRRTVLHADDFIDAIQFELYALTNGSIIESTVGPVEVEPGGASGSVYSSVSDAVIFEAVLAGSDEHALLVVPAPSSTIFRADGITVDMGNADVMALEAALLAHGLSPSGIAIIGLNSGRLWRRALGPR